jgi:WD40 repeat protein
VDDVTGKEYKEISGLTFTPDSRRIVYVAQKTDRWCVVVNGVEDAEYENIRAVVVSPDSKHVAYVASMRNRNFVVLDGVEQKKYDGVDKPKFSPDSQRMGYFAYANAKWRAVVDGVDGKQYDHIYTYLFTFTADSKHIMYVVGGPNEADKYRMVIDAEEGKEYDAITEIDLAPCGGGCAFMVRVGDKVAMVVNGKEETAYKYLASQFLAFSPDGKRWGYAAVNEGGFAPVLNGVEGKPYKWAGTITFSPDSSRLAFGASSDEGSFAVVDGAEDTPRGKGSLINGLVFSPDSKHYAYVVIQGDLMLLVVDGVDAGTYTSPVVDPRVFFDAPGKCHTIAIKDNKVVRVEAEISE